MIVTNNCDPYKVRLSLTEVGLVTGYLWVRNIAVPNNIQYTGFAELISQADGGQSRQGFKNCELNWINSDSKTLYYVRRFVDNALTGNRILYATIPLNDGQALSRRWIDISGIPLPISGEEAGNFGNFGIAYSGFSLKLNNVQIINNTASF